MPASPRKKRAPEKLSPKIPPRGKGSKGSKPSPGGKKQHKPSPKAASSSSKAKPSPKQSASSKDSPAKAKSTSKVAPKAAASGAPAAEHDETDIVVRVSKLMKTNKLSQVQVGQEARVSQAVISQWLARKYHGHNDKVDKAMEDWLVARANGTLHALVAPLSKEAQHSVLRPSHIKAPPKKKAAPQMSKAQLAEHIAESATGLTFLNPDEALEAGPGGSVDGGLGGRRKRKRPPQLNDAMHEVNQRAARRSLRSRSSLISPSEFAPVGAIGQLETPVGMPTPGNTPFGAVPQPFWDTAPSDMRDPTPRESRGIAATSSASGGGSSTSTRGLRPTVDVGCLLPPSPLGSSSSSARRSPRFTAPPPPSTTTASAAAAIAAAEADTTSSRRGAESSADKHFNVLSKMLS